MSYDTWVENNSFQDVMQSKVIEIFVVNKLEKF